LKHKPAEGERGALKYAYAVVKFKDGTENYEVVTKKEVMKRKKVSKSAGSDFSPWKNWEDEMWIKTAVKKLAKWLPLSTEQMSAVSADGAVIGPNSFDGGELNPDKVKHDYSDVVDVDQIEAEEKTSNEILAIVEGLTSKEDWTEKQPAIQEKLEGLSKDRQSSLLALITEKLESFKKKATPGKQTEFADEDPVPNDAK